MAESRDTCDGSDIIIFEFKRLGGLDVPALFVRQHGETRMSGTGLSKKDLEWLIEAATRIRARCYP